MEVWRSYNKNNFACFFRHGVDDDVIRNVEFIIEFVMLEIMLQLSSDVFTLLDIRDVISFYVLYVFCILFLYLYICVCF